MEVKLRYSQVKEFWNNSLPLDLDYTKTEQDSLGCRKIMLRGKPRSLGLNEKHQKYKYLGEYKKIFFIHISVQFSQIIPPSPSPKESKRLFYTSVSLLLFHIQSYHYHLSKFHIYALVYCIGVYETNCQSRFNAWYWMLGAGALRRPRGMLRGGRR